MELNKLKTLLIDGDGVLWRSNDPIPGLERFFNVLAQYEIDWALLTNNNTRTANDYVQKLQNFGIKADTSIVFTSSTVTAAYLKQRYGTGAAIHVVGMSGLLDTLTEAGFKISQGESMPEHQVVAVAAGMDRSITHDKIKVAMRLILNGAEFVATNTDGSFPTPDGLNPGTGMVIAMLQATTELEPTVMGKPEHAIYDVAMQRFKADPATTMMLGDRLETDILGAQRVGIGTIAVLTGVVTKDQLETSEIQPDCVYDSIAELAEAIHVTKGNA